MTYNFFIPGKMDGLNKMIEAAKAGRFGRVYSAQKKKWTSHCKLFINNAGLPKLERVSVHFNWVEEAKRRDKDNIRTCAKYILDALVEAGVLKNDGWRQIADLSDTFTIDKANAGVLVTLTEVG